MTLILTTGVHGRFVAMTGDKRRIYHITRRNPETGEYDYTDLPPIIDEKEHDKVFKISDYAIMGTSGFSDFCEYFQREVDQVVQPSDDLMDIKEKLEVIVSTALTDPDLLHSYRLRKKDGIQVMISGFLRNGETGFLDLALAEGGTVNLTLTDPTYYRYYSMATPVEDYEEVIHELFDMPYPKDIKKAEHVKKMKWIHKKIAEAHPDRVSSNGDLHVLHYKIKSGKGVIEHRESVFDT